MEERVGQVEQVAAERVEVLRDPPVDERRDGDHAETDHRHAVEATGHQAKDGSAARMDGAGRQPTTMVAKSVTKKQIG